MWFYKNVTREVFEKKKDFVEEVMLELGADVYEIELPYEQKTVSYSGDHIETFCSHRKIYTYKDEFYRVDEVLFAAKPFIVLECGTLEELLNNIMEDADPFPYDLPDEEIINEVKYSMRIEAYPKQ